MYTRNECSFNHFIVYIIAYLEICEGLVVVSYKDEEYDIVQTGSCQFSEDEWVQ